MDDTHIPAVPVFSHGACWHTLEPLILEKLSDLDDPRADRIVRAVAGRV